MWPDFGVLRLAAALSPGRVAGPPPASICVTGPSIESGSKLQYSKACGPTLECCGLPPLCHRGGSLALRQRPSVSRAPPSKAGASSSTPKHVARLWSAAACRRFVTGAGRWPSASVHLCHGPLHRKREQAPALQSTWPDFGVLRLAAALSPGRVAGPPPASICVTGPSIESGSKLQYSKACGPTLECCGLPPLCHRGGSLALRQRPPVSRAPPSKAGASSSTPKHVARLWSAAACRRFVTGAGRWPSASVHLCHGPLHRKREQAPALQSTWPDFGVLRLAAALSPGRVAGPPPASTCVTGPSIESGSKLQHSKARGPT